MKKQTFKLWQNEEGKWCCSSPSLLYSWAVADTPDKAIEGQKLALADFEQMKRHFKGACEPECRWCKDHPQTKGIEKTG